jgi:hypothetical protein
MSSIKMMPNKAGQMITVSKTNPEYGVVRIASSESAIDGATGFIRTVNKSFLIKDKVVNLTAFLDAYPNGTMPGKLINNEFIESNAPAEFSKLLNKKLSYEDAIAPYVKKAGSDGPELTVQGERILRYTSYDVSGKQFDTVVSHDNVEEVAQHNAQVKASNGANLPG